MRDDAAPGPSTPASAPKAPARLGREDPRSSGSGTLPAGRQHVARATYCVDDRGHRARPERRGVACGGADGGGEVDRDRLAGDVARRHHALHAALRRLLLHLRRGVEGHLLVAELVLLGDELALLGLQLRDVIGGLRDLCGQAELEEDRDQDRAEAEVGVTERAQVQLLGRGRARHLHEATRAAPPPRGGCVLRACGAQATSRQYAGRYQNVCLICCLDLVLRLLLQERITPLRTSPAGEGKLVPGGGEGLVPPPGLVESKSDFFRHPQARGTRSRVGRDLLFGGPHGTAGDDAKGGPVAAGADWLLGWADAVC